MNSIPAAVEIEFLNPVTQKVEIKKLGCDLFDFEDGHLHLKDEALSSAFNRRITITFNPWDKVVEYSDE